MTKENKKRLVKTKREHETIKEETIEDVPVLGKARKTGQVYFDPPYYNQWIFPKRYKRDDMGALSGWLGYVMIATLLVGLTWVAYTPRAPEWAGEGFLLQTYMFAWRLGELLCTPVPYLTGFKVSHTQAFRQFGEVVLPNRIPENDPLVEVTDVDFDGIAVKIFRPRAVQSDSPAIIYIHGGGWTFLSVDSYAATTYHMAKTFNVVVASINYRLAPEHPYPAAFDDCLKATKYFLRNAKHQGVDPNRIAIAGDSAGGNLVAAVSLKLSEQKETSQLPKLQFQVLIYPVTQMFDFNTHSFKSFSDTGYLTKEIMIHMWLNYLGIPELHQQAAEFAANNHTSLQLKKSKYASYVKHSNLPEELREEEFESVGADAGSETLSAKTESIILDPYFAPLMAEDLSKVPPAYFIIAYNDILRDDGLLYAERLRKSGVKTEVDFHENMAHGFCLLASVEAMTFQRGLQAFETLSKYVQKNL